MRNKLLDYAAPERQRPSRYRGPPSFGRLNAVTAGAVAVVLVWYLALVGAGYANRDLALPALTLSLVVCLYGFLRMTSVSWIVRALCFPIWVLVGYGVLGLAMILLGSLIT